MRTQYSQQQKPRRRAWLAACTALGLTMILMTNHVTLHAAGQQLPHTTVIQPSEQSNAQAAAFTPEMEQALRSAEQLLKASKPFPDWAAAGFAKNGTVLPAHFAEEKADLILNNGGNFDQLADLTRTASSSPIGPSLVKRLRSWRLMPGGWLPMEVLVAFDIQT